MSEIGLIRALEVAEAPGMIVSLEVLRGTPGSPGTLEWTAAAGGGVTLTGGQANPNPTPALARQADLNGLVARVAVLEGRPVIDAEFIQDTVGGMFPGATYNDTAGTITLPPGSDPEAVRDTVAAFVRAGLNVTVTHDDAGDTLTLGAAGGTAVTRPRGTGGTPFRAVTRTPGSNTYTDLLPSSPAAAFDDSVFRVLGVNGTIAGPGEDVEVTGSGLVAGKTYYVDTPVGSGPNMTAIPDGMVDGWQTGNANIVNVNRRYQEVGTVYADGAKLWLTVSTKPVELSDAPAPGYKLDLLTPPMNVRLEQPGTDQTLDKLWELTTVDPNSGARIVNKTNGLYTRGGQQVSLQITDFAQQRNMYSPKGMTAQADGEVLAVIEANEFSRGSGIHVRGAAAASNADRKGYYVALWNNRIELIGWPNATTTVLQTVSGVTHAIGTRYCVRVQFVGTTVKYKVWAYDAAKSLADQGQSEPAAWSGEYTSASYVTAGRVGWQNEGNMTTHIHAFKSTTGTGITFAELV